MNLRSIFSAKCSTAKKVRRIIIFKQIRFESIVFLAFFLETSYDDTPRPLSEQSHSNFLQSFSQRIYLSYRKQFEPFHILARNGDSISSDCGWGCMIRCAQMLLAQTLLLHMTSTIHLPYSNIQMSDKCKFLYLCFFFDFCLNVLKRSKTKFN